MSVAGVLSVAERHGKLTSLVRYFDYGRSVPGKIERWQATPGTPGNLFEVAWVDDMLAASHSAFLAETTDDGPVVRGYGMSFSDHILNAASAQRPGLVVDLHSGPGAPPNFAYARFLDDRANRRPGDIVVMGVLSSSVPAMAALSNRTWVFEQPAPVTYPVFRDGADGTLVRVEPLVRSAEEERRLASDPVAAAAWETQLAAEDAFYGYPAFGAPLLDRSPFLRLVRRRLATDWIAERRAALAGGDPEAWNALSATLERMMLEFAETARSDGQQPVILLIQTSGPQAPDLRARFASVLDANDIPHLLTVETADPAAPSSFLPDGHFRPDVDAQLGRSFLELLDSEAPSTVDQAKGSR
jgi:hypothetical protein